MTALTPVITNAGLAAIVSSQNDGVNAKITHVALGSSGREPTKAERSLVNERLRVPIAGGSRVSDTQIHLTALAEHPTLNFWVYEIGFFLEDGTMLAVWSDTNPLAYKSAGVDLLLAFDLVLSALPAASVTVEEGDSALSLAATAEQLTQMAAAQMAEMNRGLAREDENAALTARVRANELHISYLRSKTA